MPDAETLEIQKTLTAEFLREVGCSGVNTSIHPDDEMLEAIRNAYEQQERHRFVYFSSGYAALRSIEHYLEGAGRSLASLDRVLDFACGCGRVTRFLTQRLSPDKIWISDIDRAAVDFARNEFGVHGFYSQSDPADVQIEGKFDLIFVGSLFTHLPEQTFGLWLAKLYGALAPGGTLIFSTHGIETFPEIEATDSGFSFVRQSETKRLDTSEYGSSYLSHDRVRQFAEQVGIDDLHCWSRDLWLLHDLWVGRDAATPELGRWPSSPLIYGNFDSVRMASPTQAWVGGHVLRALDGPELREVRILIDGVDVSAAELDSPRPVDGRLQTDWYTEGDASSLAPGRHVVTAVAIDRAGARHCLDARILTVGS